MPLELSSSTTSSEGDSGSRDSEILEILEIGMVILSPAPLPGVGAVHDPGQGARQTSLGWVAHIYSPAASAANAMPLEAELSMVDALFQL